MRQRHKKVINLSEAATRQRLSVSASRYGAEVLPKVRIADVIDIEGSGLSNDLYGYALRAHLDLIVTDENHFPLFAVEFDGPSHTLRRARANDARKNLICERFGLPLARVRDEHVFRKVRGVDYVTWLAEVFFCFRDLVEAQESGALPLDEPLDPMMVMTHPQLPGSFPLFVSAKARADLRQAHQRGTLSAAGAFVLSGEAETGATHCIAIAAERSGLIWSEASIYLQGFGIAPSEGAEEIAVCVLAERVANLAEVPEFIMSPSRLREDVVTFLREMRRVSAHGHMGVDLGFNVEFQSHPRPRWIVGGLGSAGDEVIDC